LPVAAVAMVFSQSRRERKDNEKRSGRKSIQGVSEPVFHRLWKLCVFASVVEWSALRMDDEVLHRCIRASKRIQYPPRTEQPLLKHHRDIT
jgi:hypothetical protein